MSIITSMDHLLASPLGMYQPYLIYTLGIKVSTRFHQLSKTKLGLSPMTRARARHLNYEVCSFLMLHTNIVEDGMLLKSCDVLLLRNMGLHSLHPASYGLRKVQ
jgi:hypothetical protein